MTCPTTITSHARAAITANRIGRPSTPNVSTTRRIAHAIASLIPVASFLTLPPP